MSNPDFIVVPADNVIEDTKTFYLDKNEDYYNTAYRLAEVEWGSLWCYADFDVEEHTENLVKVTATIRVICGD